MSQNSRSSVIALKVIEMSELRRVIEGNLEELNYQTQLESMNDSELLLKVSKTPRNKTLVTIQRLRHRPLEVVLEVDYQQAQVPLQITRKRQNNSSNNSIFSYRWIWLLIVFGGAIITILGNITQSLSTSLQSTGLSENQLLGILVLTIVAILIFAFIGLPQIQKMMNQSRITFDVQILNIIHSRIEDLHQELTATSILRCWSCFKEIEFEDKICPFCGETQKT